MNIKICNTKIKYKLLSYRKSNCCFNKQKNYSLIENKITAQTKKKLVSNRKMQMTALTKTKLLDNRKSNHNLMGIVMDFYNNKTFLLLLRNSSSKYSSL